MFVLILPIAASSQWITMSLESAVKTSDIIVIGTLHDVSEETKDGFDYGRGDITVDEVLWGKAEPGQKMHLVWQNQSDISCPRVEHRGDQSKQVIWFLTLKSEGRVAADNPGRIASVEKKERVLELLREREKSNESLQPTPRRLPLINLERQHRELSLLARGG
jgi:hypothetical protein